MNFTTSDKVAMFLNKPSLQLSEAITIDMLIDMVDGVIKNYCGWDIIARNYTDTMSGDGTANLNMPLAPVNSVSSLVISEIDYTSSVAINKEDGVLYFPSTSGNVFAGGTGNVLVTYNAGYATIPSDLSYAASWLVAINYNKIAQESIGITKEQFNTVQVEYASDDIPVLVKRVLDRYRQIGIF